MPEARELASQAGHISLTQAGTLRMTSSALCWVRWSNTRMRKQWNSMVATTLPFTRQKTTTSLTCLALALMSKSSCKPFGDRLAQHRMLSPTLSKSHGNSWALAVQHGTDVVSLNQLQARKDLLEHYYSPPLLC